MTLRALVQKAMQDLPGDLVAYSGVGYKVTDNVDCLKPTPQSWDWPPFETVWQTLNKTQKASLRHRVSVRTVIHERYAMWEHRKFARGE